MKARDLKGWGSGIDTWMYALNSFIYSQSGRTEDARSMLEEAEKESRERYVNTADMATISMALGETEGAYELYERAFGTRETSPFYWVWLCFDPFRKEQKFVSLLCRTGVPESLLALGT